MQAPIKAIIFDCFGVIISDALSVLCAELGQREPEKMAEMRSIIHAANKGIIDPSESTARAAELLGLTVDEYRQAIREGEVRNQPLLDYIKQLRATYKTAMLSNITAQGIERRFPDGELSNYFDEIVISSTIGYAKPEPEAYQAVLGRLGLDAQECVFTDDRTAYCFGAEQVGLRTIVFTTFDDFVYQLTEVIS